MHGQFGLEDFTTAWIADYFLAEFWHGDFTTAWIADNFLAEFWHGDFTTAWIADCFLAAFWHGDFTTVWIADDFLAAFWRGDFTTVWLVVSSGFARPFLDSMKFIACAKSCGDVCNFRKFVFVNLISVIIFGAEFERK